MAVFKKEHHRIMDVLGRRGRILLALKYFVEDIDESFKEKEHLVEYVDAIHSHFDEELSEISGKFIKLMIKANMEILENKERADGLEAFVLKWDKEIHRLYDRITELEAEIAEMRKTEEKFNRLPAYVTPKIVAEHFNVSRYKVAKMQKKGILPEPRKHGRNRYWHKSVIRGLEL